MQIPSGKAYLSPIIDCFEGPVFSWSIGAHPDARWLIRSWMQPSRRQPTATPGHRHSDRGAYFLLPGWPPCIGEAKLIRLRSRKACSPDNSACEGSVGRLKHPLVQREADQDIPWLSHPHQVPTQSRNCDIKPVQVFIRTP
ncbi:MAG: hypothetical protein JF629_10015 [Variovorax paradoxus]|nr:hypothetical protein [Variovorax paradoxus]